MIKRMLFSIFLVVAAFGYMAMANNITHIRFEFKVNTPFLLNSNSNVALPAGKYFIRDLEVASGHLLSVERAEDHKNMAVINTVRIQNASAALPSGRPNIVFDLEDSSQLPVMKKFYLRDGSGYEILSAEYEKDVSLISLNQ